MATRLHLETHSVLRPDKMTSLISRQPCEGGGESLPSNTERPSTTLSTTIVFTLPMTSTSGPNLSICCMTATLRGLRDEKPSIHVQQQSYDAPSIIRLLLPSFLFILTSSPPHRQMLVSGCAPTAQKSWHRSFHKGCSGSEG